MLRHLAVAAALAIVMDTTARATVISGTRSFEVDAWLLPTIPLPPVIGSATLSFDNGASSPSVVYFYDQSLDSLLIDLSATVSTPERNSSMSHCISSSRAHRRCCDMYFSYRSQMCKSPRPPCSGGFTPAPARGADSFLDPPDQKQRRITGDRDPLTSPPLRNADVTTPPPQI
jgi:hypothetical protein